jgi:hypothetical protein
MRRSGMVIDAPKRAVGGTQTHELAASTCGTFAPRCAPELAVPLSFAGTRAPARAAGNASCYTNGVDLVVGVVTSTATARPCYCSSSWDSIGFMDN